jgi:protein-S-isoprenylcysteine O-methyltransferase Ste14
MKKKSEGLVNTLLAYGRLLLSVSGYVPEHGTVLRALVMGGSLCFSLYLSRYHAKDIDLAYSYFCLSALLYIGFIYATLSKEGLRHYFVAKWGEHEGYLRYEAILAFLFFHNATSLGHLSMVTASPTHSLNPTMFWYWSIALLFIAGSVIKLWSARVVGVDIYYWKDMFLGRKISEFVVSGPYKYLSNPMYGLGQLPAYAIALGNGSSTGLLAAFINQVLVFSFYFLVERRFIARVYLRKAYPQLT